MREPGLSAYRTLQNLRLQFQLHNLLLQRVGKCISFGCNKPGEQELMLQVSRRVSEAYPHRVLEGASYTNADSLSWSVESRARTAALEDLKDLSMTAEEAARKANRSLLDVLVTAGDRGNKTARTTAETLHLHTQLTSVSLSLFLGDLTTGARRQLTLEQHAPPAPSTLAAFTRFGHIPAREQQQPARFQEHRQASSLAIPESWIAWHLMDDHPMAIVMQSFVYSVASRQFVAVVEETLAVHCGGLDLAHWAEDNPERLKIFIEAMDARRHGSHEWWRRTLSMLRGLEQATWDRADAVEDMGTVKPE
jgi:hypothetical protein